MDDVFPKMDKERSFGSLAWFVVLLDTTSEKVLSKNLPFLQPVTNAVTMLMAK